LPRRLRPHPHFPSHHPPRLPTRRVIQESSLETLNLLQPPCNPIFIHYSGPRAFPFSLASKSTHTHFIVHKSASVSQQRISHTSPNFKLLLSYIEKDATTDFFLLTITVFHKYATEYLAPLRRRGSKPKQPDPKEIERLLGLPASAWIHNRNKASWSQSEHAAVYFMRMIKGELNAESSWRGEQDVWPRWSRTFWGAFGRLQDLYVEEWRWDKGDGEARRVFRDLEEEKRARGVLVALFEEIERYGVWVCSEEMNILCFRGVYVVL
ncbi:hypothetical protein QBC38DRAFT_34161, partial [Podospora fimiseda]